MSLFLLLLQKGTLGELVLTLLLSPLSLYSWVASILVRFIISIPALGLSALHYSVALIFAGPWCVATICVSLLLTCLQITLYLLHMTLVVGVVIVVLTLARSNSTDRETVEEVTTDEAAKRLQQWRVEHQMKTKPRRLFFRVAKQG